MKIRYFLFVLSFVKKPILYSLVELLFGNQFITIQQSKKLMVK